MSLSVLHTANLTIGYSKGKHQNVIQKDISLDLQKGKLIALIGKNGIGKSTFLKTITGIIEPLSGSISLNEKKLSDYDANELAQEMSLVLTESLPPSNLSVYEIIALGRQPYTNWLGTLSGEDKQKIEEAISLTGIAAFAHKKHYEISDGQLQKVLIARALAQDTPLIVLDEPTNNLDIQNIEILIAAINEYKGTLLVVSHDEYFLKQINITRGISLMSV